MTDVRDAKNATARRRQAKRSLTTEEKLQIWLQLLSGESSQRDTAQRWGVDPTTIMRIRRVARAGALSALAQSRPVVRPGGEDAELAALRAEIARLEEAVKEQAIELVLLRGKQRSGW
jgi:transposase-like protein